MSETTDTLIVLPGSGYGLAFEAPSAKLQRDELIARASEIVTVNDPDSAEAAKAAIKELAKWRTSVEKCRVIVKTPILDEAKQVDEVAKSAIADTILQEKRLSAAVGNYASEVERERQKVLREMEEKRRAEEAERQRIERERIAAGSKEKMRSPGDKGAPTAKAFKESAKTAKKK